MTQDQALDILKTGCNVFLTGAAGSGKTYVLSQYIKFLRKARVRIGITASTGIAATHINGRTIHSWCGIGIKDKISGADFTRFNKNYKLKNRLLKTKILIMDEISMLDGKRLDLIDEVIRRVRESELPFGGMQVIFCGDFFQLPPVSDTQNNRTFAVSAHVWERLALRTCYLEEQHRQTDDGFLRLLNNIRSNNLQDEDYEILNKKLLFGRSDIKNAAATKLYTHNIDVDAINNMELSKLHGGSKKFIMQSNGRGALVESLKKSCLAPEELELKKGALVMFVKNNFDKGYVNGTMGRVMDFEDGCPVIKISSGEKILVLPEVWLVEENGEVEAMIRQFPLRLAWAITVHKSQGMSLDAVEINLAKAFEYGMGYTALSRAKSLDGLKILGLNEAALLVNPEILELDKRLKEESREAVEWIAALEQDRIKESHKNFMDSVAEPLAEFEDDAEIFFNSPKTRKKKIPKHIATKNMIEDGLTLEAIAKAYEVKLETVIGHIEKLKATGEYVNIEHLKPKDFEKIKQAFEGSEDFHLCPVYEALEEKYSYADIRLARLFISPRFN